MATAQQLLEQHRKCFRCKREIAEIDILYPGRDTMESRLNDGFFAAAYERALAEGRKMAAMMQQSTPEAIAEAHELAENEGLR
jgi:hypothetical protein